MNPATSSTSAGGRPALRVTEKKSIAAGVCRLTLVDPRGERLPDWEPGAHIELTLRQGLTRQYSLCGDRWDPMSYQIAVLREPSSRGASEYIHDELSVGDSVEVGGPRNNFRMVPAEGYLLIAGGIGITPLIPMIAQAEMMNLPWTLLYSGRQLETMAFADQMSEYGAHAVVRATDTGDRLDLAASIEAAPRGTKIYCCGPEAMVDAVESYCARLPAGMLRRERFAAKERQAPVRSLPYEVELAQTGKRLVLQPGESVLDAVVAAGVPLLASCREGLCGTCETPVLAGVPDHRDSILDARERERNDTFFPCVSRAASDRLVINA